MAITNNTVTVDTTAGGVQVWAPPAGGRRFGLVIYNAGSVTIYVGASGVTSANGVPVAAGAYLTMDDVQDAVFAKAASASADVRYMSWGKAI